MDEIATYLVRVQSWAVQVNALCAQLDAGEITNEQFTEALAKIEEGKNDE